MPTSCWSASPSPRCCRLAPKVAATAAAIVYTVLYQSILRGFSGGATPQAVIADFQSYTGLTFGVDTDFTEAAATIGAQTALSTFVSLASFVLILFLRPPHRFFAAWTDPVADRRPALLVLVLTALLGIVIFTPTLSDYFGLIGAARPVFLVVVPALVAWFATLWLVLRFGLLYRMLGVDRLPARSRSYRAGRGSAAPAVRTPAARR